MCYFYNQLQSYPDSVNPTLTPLQCGPEPYPPPHVILAPKINQHLDKKTVNIYNYGSQKRPPDKIFVRH